MAEQTELTAAARGIKKVFISQLLKVFSGLFTLLYGTLVKNETVQFILGAVGFALLIAGIILEISGLKTAAPDEKGYRLAYKLSIGELCALAVTLAALVIWPDLNGDSTDELLYRLLDIFIAYTLIKTTIARLKARGHEDIAAIGRPALFFVCACYGAQAFFSALDAFIREGSVFMYISTSILAVLGVIATFFFALFLGKSWKRL